MKLHIFYSYYVNQAGGFFIVPVPINQFSG